MKVIYSEHQVDYNTYTFSYGVYCIKESHDEISEIYARGFLPYTGNLEIVRDVFYLARSVRINLEKFKDSSENRRVNRIVQELAIRFELIEKEKFNFQDPHFLSFCSKFAEVRFSGGRMDESRIRYIFGHDILSHVIIFRSLEKIYGYAFAVIRGDMLHYWYAFFDLAYLRSHSLGKWMMWRTIKWAKEQHLRYVYLGTCYKTKALYKVRDHTGVEFFDGVRWNEDVKLLKYLCKRDEEQELGNEDFLKSKEERLRNIFGELF